MSMRSVPSWQQHGRIVAIWAQAGRLAMKPLRGLQPVEVACAIFPGHRHVKKHVGKRRSSESNQSMSYVCFIAPARHHSRRHAARKQKKKKKDKKEKKKNNKKKRARSSSTASEPEDAGRLPWGQAACSSRTAEQLDHRSPIPQRRECVATVQELGRQPSPDLAQNFAESKNHNRQSDPWLRSWPTVEECDPCVMACVRSKISALLDADVAEGGRAATLWPRLLRGAYPPHGPQCQGVLAAPQGTSDLGDMLFALAMRTYRNRGLPEFQRVRVEAIEYFAGRAAVTEAHLARGILASRFDIAYHSGHDCLTDAGLSLWLDELAFTPIGSLLWFGTQCSSWVMMCRKQSMRSEKNGYWGDTSRPFVSKGNMQMVVTSLVMFVGCLLSNTPMLEQPLNSVMVKARPLSTVLSVVGAHRTVTYLGAFGGETMKPLQIWHVAKSYGELRRPRPSKFTPQAQLVKRHGDRSFSGVKGPLKASQAYPPAFAVSVAAITHRSLRA